MLDQGSPTDVRNGLRRMVTRVRLGLPEDSRRFADTELDVSVSTAPTSQLGQLLGVRHKNADLGDGVGAVAAGQQPGPVRGLGGALVPTHRSRSTTYQIA